MRGWILLFVFCFIIAPQCFAHEHKCETYEDSGAGLLLNITMNSTHLRVSLSASLGSDESWVGIGFNLKSSMVGADIYVGGVSNGVGYITDRVSPRTAMPILDTANGGTSDAVLESAALSEGTLRLAFARLMNTGDSNDFQFPSSADVYVLLAVGPGSGSAATFAKHSRRSSFVLGECEEQQPDGLSYATVVKVHVVSMLVAFMCFFWPPVLFLSFGGDSQHVCVRHLLKLHIVGFCAECVGLTVVAAYLGVAHLWEHASVHTSLGAGVACLTIAQLVGGFVMLSVTSPQKTKLFRLFGFLFCTVGWATALCGALFELDSGILAVLVGLWGAALLVAIVAALACGPSSSSLTYSLPPDSDTPRHMPVAVDDPDAAPQDALSAMEIDEELPTVTVHLDKSDGWTFFTFSIVELYCGVSAVLFCVATFVVLTLKFGD